MSIIDYIFIIYKCIKFAQNTYFKVKCAEDAKNIINVADLETAPYL